MIIFLPRQARDKQRYTEKLKKEVAAIVCFLVLLEHCPR
jgi:hypothetical protein